MPNPAATLRLTAAIAQKRIRELSESTENITWTDHVLDQMEHRGITDGDVLRVLRTGYVDEDPIQTERGGEWKCKITRHARGGREIGVVTVIWHERRLILLTTEWEDQR